VLAGGLVLLCGCASPFRKETEPDPERALTPPEIEALYRDAQDPRRFNITVYEGASGPLLSGAQRLSLEQTCMLRFISPRKSQLPVVKLEGAGYETYRALVDTSSAHSWIEPKASRRMQATLLAYPARDVSAAHVPGAARGYPVTATDIRFEELIMRGPVFYRHGTLAGLGPLARDLEARRAPDLILGGTTFKAFRYAQLNFPHRRLLLSTTRGYSPYPAGLLARVPLREVEGALAVEARIDDEPALLILDSAGEFEMALPAGGPDTVRHLEIGDLVLRNVAARALDPDRDGLPTHPRAGLALLARFVLTIDYQDGLVYFERPSR
jgi:hypothetical protein